MVRGGLIVWKRIVPSWLASILGLFHALGSPGSVFTSAEPSAISWFIILRGVDSIKGIKTDGPAPHVSKKVFVRGAPAVADGYSLSTPVFEIGRFRVVAALKHSSPRAIFRRFEIPVLGQKLFSKAAARTSVASSQICCGKNFGHSTVTSALPERPTAIVLSQSENGEATNFLARQIFQCWHSILREMPNNTMKWASFESLKMENV